MTPQIAPSILSSSFLDLRQDIETVNQSEAEWLHIDIMDGMFVPNISFGANITRSIGSISTKPLDVHLMVQQPDQYLEDFKNAGAKIITVHYEACTHLHRTLQAIRALGCKAGLALNPLTPIELLTDMMMYLDVVCVMGVNPGFAGQAFIPTTTKKIQKLNNLRQQNNATFAIEVDGGVSKSNIKPLFDSGARMFVAGSSIFKSNSPKIAIQELIETIS